MSAKKKLDFDPNTFLATIGEGRKIVSFEAKPAVFAQGRPADAVFYIQKGKVKLTVVSHNAKEATLGILSDRDFFRRSQRARSHQKSVCRFLVQQKDLSIEKRPRERLS